MLVNMSIADKEYTMNIDVPCRVEIPINRLDKENILVKDILLVSCDIVMTLHQAPT